MNKFHIGTYHNILNNKIYVYKNNNLKLRYNFTC